MSKKIEIDGGLQIKAKSTEGSTPEMDERVFSTEFAWDDDNEETTSLTARGLEWKVRFRDYEAEDPNTPEIKKFISWVSRLIARGSNNKNRYWVLPDQSGTIKIEEQKGGVILEGNDLRFDTSQRTFVEATLNADRTFNMLAGESGRDVVVIIRQNSIGGHKLTWAINQTKWPKGFDNSVDQRPNAQTLFLFRHDGVYWHYVAGGIVQEPKLSDPSTKNFIDDAAATSGGVPVGGVYHNAGALRVRLT